MQSEQFRQRKRERKRLERAKKRRNSQMAPGDEVERLFEWGRAPARESDAQMCARGDFEIVLTRREAVVVNAAMRAARQQAGRPLSPDECLERIAQQYIDDHEPHFGRGPRKRALTTRPGTSRTSSTKA